MARATDARLTDLRRIKAWPLLSFAVLTCRLSVDLDLLLAKDIGGFGYTAETVFPDDYAAARGVAARLGWSPRWTLDMLHECLPLVLAVTSAPMRSHPGRPRPLRRGPAASAVVTAPADRP